MICVFLDTNILHSKSADFTKARFADLRDTLLPKLISGEINVSSVEL